MSSASERIARAGAISLVGSATSAGLALVLTVVVGRALGTADTGLFFEVVAVFTVVTTVLRLGANTGLIRSFVRLQKEGQPGHSLRILLVACAPVVLASIVTAGASFALADVIATWLNGEDQEQTAELVRWLSLLVCVAPLLGVLQSGVRMLRGVLTFELLQDIGLSVGRLVSVAAAIAAGAGLVGVVMAWGALLPFWLVVTVALLVRPLAQDRAARLAPGATSTVGTTSAREFWAFSSTRAVAMTLEILLEWSDVILVAALATPAEAGVYAVATRAVRAGQVVDRAVRVAVSPRIAHLLLVGDLPEARRLHTDVTRAAVLVTWPFYLTLTVMAPAVLSVFGPEFRDGALVLAILAAAMLPASAAGMLQSIILMGGGRSWQVVGKGLAVATSIGLNLVLIPVLGYVGAAITWVVVVLVDNGLAAWLVHTRIKLSVDVRQLLPAVGLALGVFGLGGLLLRLALGTTLVDLVVALLVMSVVYLGAVWTLRWPLGLSKALEDEAGQLGHDAQEPQPAPSSGQRGR